MNRTLVALLAAGLCIGTANAQNTAVQKASPDKAANKAEPVKAEPTKAKSLEDLFPAQESTAALTIGSKAPELKIAEWVRGTPVSGFEKGRVYVVEFWATWCGPCIIAFPHLAELQAKHADKVTVIGVNIWENKEGEERAELVRQFVADHEEMAYTVALEEGTAMAETWMKAAGRNGIPAAFIVDGNGTIAWIGHPMAMDAPLEQIAGGKFDMEATKKSLAQEQRLNTAHMALRSAAMEQEWSRAAEIATALINEGEYANRIGSLNYIGWTLSLSEDAPEQCYKIAHKAAKMANEQTEWKEWALLSTYAQTSFRTGEKAEAVKWITKALELAPDGAKSGLQQRLEQYGNQG